MIKIIGIGILAYLFFELQRQIYRDFWNQDLLVKVFFSSAYVYEGDEGELLEVIENRKRLPLPMLKVKFQTSRDLVFADTQRSGVTDRYYRNDVFQISGGERITRTLRFVGKKRGYYKIQGVDLVSADLFLTTEMVESREMDGYFYVYPKPYSSRELQFYLQQINGELLVKHNFQEDPFEYRGIREYQPFDDIRSVNWKATARLQGLMVNQKGYTTRQTVRIFLNIEDSGILKKDDAVECCFQIAAGISRFFLTQGIKVAIYCNGVDMISHNCISIAGNAGNGQMDSINKALARVDLTQPAVRFVETFQETLLSEGRTSQTFLVTPNAYEDFLELVRKYHSLGLSYDWFYPVWGSKEPPLPEWVKSHVRVLHIGR